MLSKQERKFNNLFSKDDYFVLLMLDGHCGAVVPDFVPGDHLHSFIRAIFHKCQIYTLFGNHNKKVIE